MWFAGTSRDEIAQTLLVGEGTVSAIVDSLPRCLEPLRRLAKKLLELNVSLDSVLERTLWYEKMRELDVGPEHISALIETVTKTSQEAGYTPKELIGASLKIWELEKETGKRYPDALNEAEARTRELVERRKENAGLQTEIQENRRLRDEVLYEAQTTRLEMANFLDCRASLRKYGIDIGDAETVNKALSNVNEAGGNAKRLVDLAKRHGSIRGSVAYLDGRLRIKREALTDLESRNRAYLEANSKLRAENNQLSFVIGSQKNAINSNICQINSLSANIEKLRIRKDAMIAVIGKLLGLTPEKILSLQMECEFEIVQTCVDIAMKDFQLRAQRQLLGDGFAGA